MEVFKVLPATVSCYINFKVSTAFKKLVTLVMLIQSLYTHMNDMYSLG